MTCTCITRKAVAAMKLRCRIKGRMTTGKYSGPDAGLSFDCLLVAAVTPLVDLFRSFVETASTIKKKKNTSKVVFWNP